MDGAGTVERAASAEGLRRRMAEKQAARLDDLVRQKALKDRAERAFAERFLHEPLTKRDLGEVRLRVMHAAEDGAFEALVMRFPSALCDDGGRAINNFAADWPRTLPGKARVAYLLWEKWAKPRGFGLRAQIVDYPDGMPGDVGLYVTWAPPAT
jgi:hypothetical protein